MNPFMVGDRVKYLPKNRRNGLVQCIFCGACDKCKGKTYAECTADFRDRVKVLVAYEEVFSCRHVPYRYDYIELEHEDADYKQPPSPMSSPFLRSDTSSMTERALASLSSPSKPIELPPPIEQSLGLFPADIRKLGTMELDVPLIVPEDGWSEIELEIEPETKTETTLEVNDDDIFADEGEFTMGMGFDQFTALTAKKMGTPI